MEFGLNPFEFRAGLKRGRRKDKRFEGLNPFEFRAGLKPYNRPSDEVDEGLNPFEFRAGLKLAGGKVNAGVLS